MSFHVRLSKVQKIICMKNKLTDKEINFKSEKIIKVKLELNVLDNFHWI